MVRKQRRYINGIDSLRKRQDLQRLAGPTFRISSMTESRVNQLCLRAPDGSLPNNSKF